MYLSVKFFKILKKNRKKLPETAKNSPETESKLRILLNLQSNLDESKSSNSDIPHPGNTGKSCFKLPGNVFLEKMWVFPFKVDGASWDLLHLVFLELNEIVRTSAKPNTGH